MEEAAMFLIKWFGQSSVPASKNSGAADKLRGGRGTRRRRSQPLSWDALEARQLLAHATIAPAAVKHPGALVADLAPAASRKPALDPTLETLFLEGVEREVVGITPSPGLVAPYLKMLEDGVPRVQVLERLLESPAARDATVAYAYELLLHRVPSAAERGAMETKLARGGDLRTLLVSLASSSEYYVSQGGGTEAGFLNALKADLLGPTAPMPDLPGKLRRPDDRTRSALARAIVFSKEFDDQFLEVAAPRITGVSLATPGLIVQARNALQRPGGMTRALAILLASDTARALYAQSERLAELPAPPNPTPSPTPVGASTPQSLALTVPTDFGGALTFNAVSSADTLSGQPAPTVALPNGLINQAGNQVTYEVWFNAQTSGALLQMQLSGNGQTSNVPILSVDANGKLTGGLFDVNANGQLAPGSSGPGSSPITPSLTPGSPTTIDAGFEAPVLGTGNWLYGVTGSPWSFSGTAGISANNSAFTSGNPLAPEGLQVALLQQNGSFSQSVYGWDAGSYQLSFEAAQRANSGASNEDFQVLVDGAVVGKFTPSGSAYQNYTTAPFPVAAGSHTITFQGLDSGGDDYTAFIDDIKVTALNTLTSPLTLDYSVNSPNNDNPYTYQIVGPNNAMVSAATVLDQNWHEAALVVDGNNEQLYLDGLLVGAAQAANHYSLSFTDASGNTYAPTGAGFLGGTVDPLAISVAAHPPAIGYPAGFVGSLSELRVWSVARTQDQIEQSMDAPLPLDPTPPGLIGYYDFAPLTQIKTLSGPPLAQIAVVDGGVWAVDETGTVQSYNGTAFQPVKTPTPAKMLADGGDGAFYGGDGAFYVLYPPTLFNASNLYFWEVSPNFDFPFPLVEYNSNTALAQPSWIGFSSGEQGIYQGLWMISGGKIYFQYLQGLSLVSKWVPESFPGSATSVAPLGGNASDGPYGSYEQWGSLQVRALATDESGNLWISVLTGDPAQPQPYQEARVLLAGADGGTLGTPLSQVYAGQDGSVWAIDAQQNVYKLVSVTPDGTTYDCSFEEIPQLHGTTSLAVSSDGTVYSLISGATYEWVPSTFANSVPGSPFGPVTTDAGTTGTSLSATDVASVPSTIPADPFGDVPRLPGYQDFAPYLAVPYSNSAPTVDLAAGPNQVEYQVTLDAGDTVIVEVPGGQSVNGPFQVDFLGFTTNPADGSHPVVVSYPQLAQVSNEQGLNDLIQNNMAAAFVAPEAGTYLIRITGPAQGNSANSAIELQFSVLPGNSNSLLTLIGTQTVQGGRGTTVAAYTDPAAPPGASISQLLPTPDPALELVAYKALVKAAQVYVSQNYPGESFTDFLNVNTGVTISPQHLFGLQDRAYQAVQQNPLAYLGTSRPFPGLLAALVEVKGYLDSVDSLRQNVYAFVQAQDSWIQKEINNILGQNALSTIAQTIVDNQEQNNPRPYLQPPPPSTPYSMDADAAIQGGRQALAGLQAILTPLLFAGPAAPVAGVLFGLLNVGATIGATYASDTLKKTAAQIPTLIVPPDKNQISTLIQAASTYQAQLISGLNAQENLANEPQFYDPLFSNVGLLKALANLNPLVLSSTKADDQLGPNNPTAAAVTYSAWQTLLPDYFHWAPVDPTTESQSQNFANLYPGATPASPGNAVQQLQAMQVTGSYSYPGFSQTSQIVFSGAAQTNIYGAQYSTYYPTSMASFPTGTASGGGTEHPERFYGLVQADLSEGSNGSDSYNIYYINGGSRLATDNFSFAYGTQGLSVLGWQLVDANGIEIDPRTAAMVFPTGSAIQPVTNGPAFVSYGGGWYLNVGPPSPLPPGSSLYQTRVNPSEVYIDWFGQSTLVPFQPLSGNLQVGALSGSDPTHRGSLNVPAPSYNVSYSPITSAPPSVSFDAIEDPGFEQVSTGPASSITSRPARPGPSLATPTTVRHRGQQQRLHRR
jgi:hypothetical protein